MDDNTGHGGSYIVHPDGTRELAFRTGVGAVAPEPPADPKPKQQAKAATPAEED